MPKTYEDLLDPKWKGKLGIEADDAVWFGALVDRDGRAEGAASCSATWCAPTASRVRKGHTLIANLVVSGEVPFALTVYHYKAEQLKNAAARRSSGTCCRPASRASSAPA